MKNKINYNTLPYIMGKYGQQAKPLTKKAFDELTTSMQTRRLMALIENETDAERKNVWKEKLPAIQYASLWNEDGQRVKNATARPSGLCMHDWDHMPCAPRTFYIDHVQGHEQEMGIVLAHITPRGEGLRLVTVLPEGESIVGCQKRLARTFGMQQCADEKVKDAARISFLPSSDYMLFVDEARLFDRGAKATAEKAEEKAVEPSAEAAGKSAQKPSEQPVEPAVEAANEPAGKNAQKPSEQPVEPAVEPSVEAATEPAQKPVEKPSAEPVGQTVLMPVPSKSIAENFDYQGLKYSVIIEQLLQRIATGGEPREGERNEDLYALTRELRHICEYNFSMLHMLVAPYFPGLSDQEIRRTISSALSSAGSTITPMMKGVLAQLRSEADGESKEVVTLDKLPRLAPIEEMIISHFPKHLRAQVYLASLPIWGTYGTHIRFDYLDGRVNSLSFMTSVVGKSGSGKSFAVFLYNMMTEPLQLLDAEERQKAERYYNALTRAADSSEKPEDPRPRIRLIGDDITTNQVLEYLCNLNGEHALQVTEEVSRLQKSKRSIWGDNDDLYCKAFDNALGGKESKSMLTRNIRIPIYLNTLFCGTPGAMHKFYNNPEGGLNNRILFAFMPNARPKGIPRYTPLNEQEREALRKVQDMLSEAAKDGKKTSLPWLDRTVLNLSQKWEREDAENPNEVWFDLGKRSLVMGYRAGVLEWYLRGCPDDEKELRAISRVVRWVAESARASIYAFSGQDYEAINETDNALQQKQGMMTKTKKLFSLLADEFTTQDVINQRIQNGDSGNAYMVTKRWVDEGLIMKTGRGRFRKLRALGA